MSTPAGKVITAIGAVLLLGGISNCANSGTGSERATTVASAPSADAVAASDKAAAAKAAAYKAASEKANAEKAAAEAAAAEKAAKAASDPASYKTIGARDYALLVKDPDAHVGDKYVIYGNVTQFDSATGTDTFRANTASSRKSESYEYDQNVIVTADDESILADVVQDDLVTLYVEVLGSFSYDTQIGGNTTVPKLGVHIIKVTGSTT